MLMDGIEDHYRAREALLREMGMRPPAHIQAELHRRRSARLNWRILLGGAVMGAAFILADLVR